MTSYSDKKYSMNISIVRTTLSVGLIAISVCTHAQNSLVALSVTETTPTLTQMQLDFDAAAVSPVIYQTNAPPQLILDFNEVTNKLPSRFNVVNQGAVDNVTIISDGSTTRMVVDIADDAMPQRTQAIDFSTQIFQNSVLLNISNNSSYTAPVAATIPANTQTTVSNDDIFTPSNETFNHSSGAGMDVINSYEPKPPLPSSEEAMSQTMVVQVNPLLDPNTGQQNLQSYNYDGVDSINYSDGEDGGGNVSVTLTNPSIPIDVQRQGNKIIIYLTGATVPQELIRRMDIDGGLVATVDANNRSKNGILTISMQGDFEYQAYQSDNQLNISIQPPKLLREPTLEEKVYTGEPLSIEFQDMPIRSVLDVIAEFTKLNIVVSDNVSGNLTLRLYDVPWDQALDIILKSKNLGKRRNGNVIIVAPAVDLANQEAEALEALQKVDAFLPLRTEYIRLSYAKAGDVLTMISNGRSSGSNTFEDTGSLLSDRGTVTIDERTNTLIVQDTSDSIENVRKLIDKIDIPVRQVMIEARIVSANDSFSKEMGVKWGILSNGAATNRNLLVGGSNKTVNELQDFTIQTATVNGQSVSYPSYSITSPDNLNVDLGVANAAGRIAFGLLSMSDVMIDLELSAMQADGRGEVISTPKVLTMDKQTAKVASGTQIPYQEATASGATATSFAEAALSLEVTPNITPDGKIALELNIQNGSPDILNGSVAISLDSILTNVILEDGQTVVLGGIFSNQITNDVEKVPFLGDLPYVGKLFRKDTQSNTKKELLIFVTPKLVTDSINRIN